MLHRLGAPGILWRHLFPRHANVHVVVILLRRRRRRKVPVTTAFEAVLYPLAPAVGVADAGAIPAAGDSGYKIPSKAVVTGIEPAAPAVSTDKDDCVHIAVPREKVAPVDTGRTETVQHHVSQSAGPQRAAPVFQSVPVQLPHPRRGSVLEIPAPFRTRVSRSCNLAGLAIRA